MYAIWLNSVHISRSASISGVLMHIIPDPGGSPRHDTGTDQANDRGAGIRSMAFSLDSSSPSTESPVMLPL